VESNQPPATYQIAMLPLQHRTSFQVGMVGVEPTRSCSQGTQAAVTLHPVVFVSVRTAGLARGDPRATE
jgi:hypothetical protein